MTKNPSSIAQADDPKWHMQHCHENIAESQVFNQCICYRVESSIPVNSVDNQRVSDETGHTYQAGKEDFEADLDVASAKGITCYIISGTIGWVK